MATASSVPDHQVFLNFRGKELRNNFISHLAKALRDKNIQLFIDEAAEKGQPLDNLFLEIEKSRIALAVFSKWYTESDWCLNELERIKERTEESKLVTIPIFYNVEPATVRYQMGSFGDALQEKEGKVTVDQMNKWKEALAYVSSLTGFPFNGKSNESLFINEIAEKVLQALSKISSDESTSGSLDHSRNTKGGEEEEEKTETGYICGLEQRLEELAETVDIKGVETRIVQVVGMPGIGKTTLLKAFYDKWNSRFVSRALLQNISGIVKERGLDGLRGMLLKELLDNDDIDDGTYEQYKEQLSESKVFIVLDGTSDERHIQVLLEGHCEWTKKGSKIVIATRAVTPDDPKICHTYFVPLLRYRDGLEHFGRYAFDHSSVHQTKQDREAFLKVSKEVVRYGRGHPLILKLLGEELRGKPLSYWKERVDSLPQSLSQSIKDQVLQVTYDELSQEQKDAFLDIACFRSHDLVYVKSLLDSSGPGNPEAMITIEALKDKFMIYISDSRVEMHDLLYTFAMELGPKAYAADGRGRHRIWHRHNKDNGDMLNKLRRRQGGGASVRSFFLDLYDMKRDVTLGRAHLKKMRDLRYLKFYSSHCPHECEPKENIHIPEELELPLEEVRCLHWLNFSKDELPQDFNPKNLVDLKLPYSKIKQIWKDDKDAPKLRWVDLNHSSKLVNLSGLSQVQNLERLNLEGCTALKTLPLDMQNMASLVFLNLKGCTSLESLPKIKLKSLRTFILSNCSNLKKFWVISVALHTLYLDGSAITKLPTDMFKLTSLIKLNMKDCKDLETLPEGFGNLENLQELVLSGCSKLNSLLDEMENMKCLQILMLDGTAIEKIPKISSLQRLCLTGNDKISFLPDNISLLYQLKWLDLKYCEKLLSIPELPPNLQCLDAHGCKSLKTVANPLATHMPSEQIHSTFIFTNCGKLDRTAKEEITAYTQRKCQLLSDALRRCNEGFVPEALFSTCFPGCEVPSWFSHEAVGSELKLQLSPHWNENRFVGIALCAVLSFPNGQEQINSFSITCKFNLESKETRQDGTRSRISFDRLVGSWNRHGKKPDKIEHGKKPDKMAHGMKPDKMASDHVFICYTRCSNNIKCFENQHSGTCTPTTASLEFSVTDEKAKVEVLKCGLRLVYATDEPQKTISDVTARNDNNDSTPIRNGSFSRIGSGSLSSSGEDSCGSNEAFLQRKPIGR